METVALYAALSDKTNQFVSCLGTYTFAAKTFFYFNTHSILFDASHQEVKEFIRHDRNVSHVLCFPSVR